MRSCRIDIDGGTFLHGCIEIYVKPSTYQRAGRAPRSFPHKKHKRVGVLGTRVVMESKLYGLVGVEVVTIPSNELGTAHANYVSIAIAGKATEDQRAYFEEAAERLIRAHGAQAVVLGGTDLFLALDRK